MKKRTISILLAAMLAFSMTACGNGRNQEEQTNAATQESEETDTQGTTDVAASETEETTDLLAEEAGVPIEETDIPAEETETPTEVTTDLSSEETNQTDTSAQGSSNMLVAYFTYAENADLPDGVDASSSASIQIWNDEMTGNTGAVARMISEAAGAEVFSIQTVEKYPDSYDATIDQGQAEQSAGARPELSTHIENLDSYDTIFLGFPNWWGDMPMAVYSFLDEYDLAGKTIVPFVTSGGSGFSGSISVIENMEPGATVQEGLSLSDSSVMDAQNDVNEWLGQLGYLQ